MFSLKLLVLFMISMNCIQSISESEYCTQSSDAENIFNIFDRVYIRTKDNSYWSYDSINQQLDEKPIDINDMFGGSFKFVEHVIAFTPLNSCVSCDKLKNLVIAIGRNETVSPTFGYVVFRLGENRTLAKITGSDLPIEWDLKSSAVIKSKGAFGLFWPPDEYLFLDQDVNPDIRDFTYYSPLQLVMIRNRGNTYKYKFIDDNDWIDWRNFTPPLITGRSTFEMNGFLFNADRYNGVMNIMDNFTLKLTDNRDLTIDLKKEVGLPNKQFFGCSSTTLSSSKTNKSSITTASTPSETTETASTSITTTIKKEEKESSNTFIMILIIIVVIVVVVLIAYFVLKKKTAGSYDVKTTPESTEPVAVGSKQDSEPKKFSSQELDVERSMKL